VIWRADPSLAAIVPSERVALILRSAESQPDGAAP
jgi:hypothetical protein